MKAASENEMKGILGYCEDPLVSQDFVVMPELQFLMSMPVQLNPTFYKIISWYDKVWIFKQVDRPCKAHSRIIIHSK